MKTRTRYSSALLAAGAFCLAAVAIAGCTQTEQVGGYAVERRAVDGLPRVTATSSEEAEVKVQAIDYSTRSIALASTNGDTHIFHVSGDIRNFYQIKQGDSVKVKYEEELNVSVRKADTPLTETELITFERAPIGAKPGLVAVRTVETLATVLSIDHQARTVVLKTADGRISHVTVSPKLPEFDKVQVGDQVDFDYTEALSITVSGTND